MGRFEERHGVVDYYNINSNGIEISFGEEPESGIWISTKGKTNAFICTSDIPELIRRLQELAKGGAE